MVFDAGAASSLVSGELASAGEHAGEHGGGGNRTRGGEAGPPPPPASPGVPGIFERTYVVNLARAGSRWSAAQLEFARVGLAPTRVDGVDGALCCGSRRVIVPRSPDDDSSPESGATAAAGSCSPHPTSPPPHHLVFS